MFSLSAAAWALTGFGGSVQVRFAFLRKNLRKNAPPPVTIVMEVSEENLPYHIFLRRRGSRCFLKRRSIRESTGAFVQMGYDAEVQAVPAPESLPCPIASLVPRIGPPCPHGPQRGRFVLFEVLSAACRLKNAEKRRYPENETRAKSPPHTRERTVLT